MNEEPNPTDEKLAKKGEGVLESASEEQTVLEDIPIEIETQATGPMAIDEEKIEDGADPESKGGVRDMETVTDFDLAGGDAERESGEVSSGELAQTIEQLQNEAKANYDRMLRAAADLENFKRRARRDQRDAVERAENRIVLEFIPVIDNLERAIAHAEEAQESADDDSFAQGVGMVHKQFLATLAKYDIVPFDSVGEAFNPELHEAIQQSPSDKPRHSIIAEIQRGYLRGDKLVRPAQVIVSMGLDEEIAAEEQSGDDTGVEKKEPSGDEIVGTEDDGELEKTESGAESE